MKTTLITGVSGQDGSYLAEFLLKKNYRVIGLIRKTSAQEVANIVHLNGKISLVYGDLLDSVSLLEIVKKFSPSEVYNLAAQSYPGESWRMPIHTVEITGLGAHRVFEAVRQSGIKAKIYQASSSEMYGYVKKIPQDEETPFNPANPYAAAKLYAHSIAGIYRRSFGMFISCGILFNHESPRRGMGFVSQKITYAAACIKLGIKTSDLLNEEGEPIVANGKIALGNLDAKRDWGFAGDYVEAIWRILQLKTPQDLVIGTGETRSIREFCQEAFSYLGLDWEKYVHVDQRFVRPTETGPLVANPAKAKKILGWKPKTSFKKLVAMMVDAHLARLK